jgi:hypothetical protein
MSARAISATVRGRAPSSQWAPRLTAGLGVVFMSCAVGVAAATPHASLVFAGLLAIAITVGALTASPEAVLGASAIVFGTFQLSDSHPIHAGTVSLYSTDLLLCVLLLRAFSARERSPGGVRMSVIPKALAVMLAIIFVYADWRGHQAGLPLRSLVRTPMALLFIPLYTFAFSRILRERTLDLPRLYRVLGGIGLGFIVVMLGAHVTGKTFATTASFSQNSNGYKVVTADGTLLRRDYGFPSAFILYPALALSGLGCAVYATRKSYWAVVITIAGSMATFLTLIRGEIFGLMVGAVVLYAISPRGRRIWTPRRAQSLALVLAATAVGALVVGVSSPALATGLAERTLPGVLSQGDYAQKTADDRLQAVGAGYQEAARHPLGIGFREASTLATETGVDPLFVTHSTPAWLLVFTGWPGLVIAIGLIVASIVASFSAQAREPWHHPAYVALACFFLVYSFSTFGLVGQPWVIGVASLLVAVRFTQVSETEA